MPLRARLHELGAPGRTRDGLDFSQPAIDAANALATELGLDATFVVSDVYDAPQALERTFDIVYTGIGALCWLPDIPRWARVVRDLLRPGGVPCTWSKPIR